MALAVLSCCILFCQGCLFGGFAGSYVHIQYGAFVALDIMEVYFMGFSKTVSLFFECFRLAKFRGMIACAKYLCGALPLQDLDGKSSVFSLGGPDG